MQKEFNGTFPDKGVKLLGVNGAGFEVGVPQMITGRFLPLLQDTVDVNAWGQWAVTYRDVVILDRQGVPVGVFNLTDHDLAVMFEYETLKGMLLDAADL